MIARLHRIFAPRLLGRLATFLLGLSALTAQAAITCTIAPPAAVNFAYVSTTNNTSPANLQQGSVSVTCTRTSASDPTTLDLKASNGLYKSGSLNYVQLNSSKISYDVFANSACTDAWSSKSSSAISLTLTNLALRTPVTSTFNYWACKPIAQNVSSFPSGTYTDRVDITLITGSTTLATSSININLYAPAACSISNGPSNLSFSYAAFSPSAAFAGTSFRANCTNYLPYTMTLDQLSGVVGGLRYTLGLSLTSPGTASNIGTNSLSTQGNVTGTATHYINGLMAAGQAGQSGTIVPQPHLLTITY
ncbi:MAG: spore coat protein U domain-containing protein [Betaproteobacteria bacterium]